MPRHLTPEQIKIIVRAIECWSDPDTPGARPTWADVIIIVKSITKQIYTRAALSRHKEIKEVYESRKDVKKDSSGRPKSKTLLNAEKRIKSLEDQVEYLKDKNTKLTEQFIRWSYNASLATRVPLTEEDLEKPIPRPRRVE